MPFPSKRHLWVILGVTGAGLLWAGGVVFASRSARADLTAAENSLSVAEDHVLDADLGGARSALENAALHARAAHAALSLPHVRLAAALPFVGNSLDVATVVAKSSVQIIGSANSVVDTISGLPEGLNALRPTNGAFPVSALERLSGPLQDLAVQASEASTAIDATPSTWLLDEALTARTRFAGLAADLTRSAAEAAALAEQLPAFLGTSGARRYFVAVANPAELRAVGGFVGAYSILTVDEGAVELASFRPTWDLPSLPPGTVEPPDPTFAERYDGYDATGLWSNINMTPDFPTAATAFERLWDATQPGAVDGTILVDPFAFEALVRLTGAVEMPETGVRLGADRVVDYVTHTSFEDLRDARQRKEAIGDVAAATLQTFLGGHVDVSARRIIRVLGEVVGGRHLMLHAVDPEEEAAFLRAGIGGALPDPAHGLFLTVALNSGSGSKVDYWLDHEMLQRVRLLEGGRAQVETEVTLVNHAPTEGIGWVVGPNAPGLEAGDSRLMVSVYCGSRCDFQGATGPPSAPDVGLEEELGQPVATSWVTIPSGDRVTLRYQYEVADAWTQGDATLSLPFSVLPPTTVRPTHTTFELEVPSGFHVDEMPDGARLAGRVLLWESDDRGLSDARVSLTVDRAGAAHQTRDAGPWPSGPRAR